MNNIINIDSEKGINMSETGKEPARDIVIVGKEKNSIASRDKSFKWRDKTDGSAPKEAEDKENNDNEEP